MGKSFYFVFSSTSHKNLLPKVMSCSIYQTHVGPVLAHQGLSTNLNIRLRTRLGFTVVQRWPNIVYPTPTFGQRNNHSQYNLSQHGHGIEDQM